ncbi:P-loop containing nucleoside triphosphate hydrolase protein, partial [Catenaria anguillulae PL171]
ATQKFTIAPIIQGFNSLIQAPYLSGKTTSLLIAVLQRTNLNISKTQALILAPTREQAKHLHQVLKSMTAPTQGNIRTHLCAGGIGGSSALDDIKAARSGPHIVVGTLGRMCDVFASGRGGYNKADVSRVEMVAFDDFGDVVAFPDFSDRVPALIRAMPRGVQLVVTSSTMTPAVLDFTNKFMGSSHVKRIHVPHIDPSNTKIVHSVIRVQEPRHKHMDLIRLLMSCKAKSFDQAIVFTNTSRELEWLADMISSSTNGVWQAATFHRESGPGQRSQVVQNFNSGKVKVLVTSDLLGRGLSDMRQVSLVVHYNVPVAPEDYMRRSTRCTVRCEVDGGAKRCGKGMVVSLVTEEEREMMSIIEMAAGVGIDE